MSKNVLIVGASSGIGRRLAELNAGKGNKVGIIARREYLLKEIQLQFPSLVFFRQADISMDSFSQIVDELIQEMGGIDILIHAAAVIETNPENLAASELKSISINVKGFVQVMNTAWHYFKNKGGGHIVSITSIAAARGNKSAPAYNASKAFQSSYTEGLRIKARHEKNNISITELIPGYVDTDMGKSDRAFWVIPADKAARLAYKAISQKRKRAFIPERWWWIYTFLKVLPAFIYDALVNSTWQTKSKA
jgi:short-subunit dehydrogenase